MFPLPIVKDSLFLELLAVLKDGDSGEHENADTSRMLRPLAARVIRLVTENRKVKQHMQILTIGENIWSYSEDSKLNKFSIILLQ